MNERLNASDPRPLCDPRSALLLVIDLQGKIFEMAFNHQRLGVLADKLMRLAELFEVPLILTEQYPQGLGATAPALRATFEQLSLEDKHLVEKTAFGCCGEERFNQRLAQVAEGVRQRRATESVGPGDAARPIDVVVAGIETHVCVQQTVLELLQRPGYRVVVLRDCVGGRVHDYHRMALERFRQCGAVLSNFESLAFEWTRDKNDPRFKQMSALVKAASAGE